MDILTPSDSGYERAANLLLNEDQAWRNILIDNKKGQIVNNTGTLRHEDHRRIQSQVVELRRHERTMFSDIEAAGLTSPESITTMLVGRENVGGFQNAQRSMNPVALNNNQIDFSLEYTPLPIITSTWRIPYRQLGFAYKRSASLDESVFQVRDNLDDMIVNGAPEIKVAVNGTLTSIVGYATSSYRQTNGIDDWVTTPASILPETLELVDKLFQGSKVSRPNSAIMYVANNIWTKLQDDYSTTKGDRTHLQRIEAVSQIREVKPSPTLATGEVLLVEMSSRTIDAPMASGIVTIPHARSSQMSDQVFTTMVAASVMIKQDRNGATGIVHGTRP